MHSIITDTPYENKEFHTLYNDLSIDEDEPVLTVPNQSTNANCNVAECSNETDVDESDISSTDIVNQMHAPMQKIVNNAGGLDYG